MKLNASPGGGASIIITDTHQCSNNPINGALRGLFEAHNREKGRMPSRPISWTRRPWEKITERTFPKADRATKTERARSALAPNMLRKKEAARIRPEEMISALGTAAKYAI
jgi:hypothetical protein